ncbi:MAG: carboxypeptidase-like regulatory domain-containing protein [Planctomycetota bacterium]
MNHFSLGTLAEHLEHRLPAADQRRVEEHLRSGCERCNDEVGWLTQLRERTAADDSADPPDWLLERALTLFRRVPAAVIGAATDSYVGSLVYDSAATLTAGVRQATTDAERSLLFRCEGFEVDLQIRRRGARFLLRGQILAADPAQPPVAGASVELVDLSGVLETTATDAFGEFAFDDLPHEEFDLRIRPHAGGDLYLPGIEIMSGSDELS